MKARTELWILCFLGFGVNYMLRTNINIAMVDMVVKKQPHPAAGNESAIPTDERTRYHWNEYEQNLILSAYYWTNWLLQLPGGILAHHYGSKHTLGFNNLLVALLTFLIPVTASYGLLPLFILRAVQGLIAGCFWSAAPVLVSKWIPPKERGTFLSAYLGSSVGTAFTYFTCGYIIEWYGWEYAYYGTGVLGLLWCILWMSRAHETPRKHPTIAKEELEYIEQSLGGSVNRKNLSIPWRKIFTSRPILINALAQLGVNSAVFALLTHTPTYLNYIHGLPIAKNGIWSGISNLTRWLFALAFGLVTQKQRCLNTTNVRKLATAIASFGVAFLFFILAFTECDVVSAVIIISMANTLGGTIPAGPLASIIDMCPNFAGIIQGLIGMFACTPGFVFPLIVGYLTQNNQTPAQWQKIFLIIATVATAGGLIYMIFGTSEMLPWNTVDNTQKELKSLNTSNPVKRKDDESKKEHGEHS